MLRIIGWTVVAVLAAVVIGGGSVVLADVLRSNGEHPGPCDTLLQPARGDLREDGDVLARAWAALADPRADTVGPLDGDPPVLERSCLLFAGRTPGGATVVYADAVVATVAGSQSLVRIAEVRVPDDPGRPAQRAVTAHSTRLGAEFAAGVLLPLSGDYLAPGEAGEVSAVRVLSAADGYAAAAAAPAIGQGLFDLGVAPDRSAAPDEQAPNVDALLMLEGDIPSVRTVALPVGPERADPLPARAAYTLTVDGARTVDEGTLRRIGPALSTMSADPRYPLVRDRAARPPSLEATTSPLAVLIAPSGAAGTGLPVFPLLTPGTVPI